MRTVAEHRAAALALVTPLAPVRVALDDAGGLVLAADVRSPEALPRWDNSAMDGYAVRHADVAAAAPDAPVVLRVLADLPAGTDAEPLVTPGTAARIMTGAPVPPGADAVVPVEDTDAGTGVVRVDRPAVPGVHVRRAGEDVAAGDLVLARGTVLGPAALAAAASVGAATLEAHPAPRVAVLSTGSELVAPGEPVPRGRIPDSNSFLLAAAAREAGASVVRVGAVPDDVAALAAALDALDGTVDLVVTSGGVSVGAYDVVKELLRERGVEFVRVAMQPGKPQGLGRLGRGTPALCLPGNPVSAFVSFEAFVRPVVLRLAGHEEVGRPVLRARVAEGWRSPPGRAQHMPVTLEGADGDLVARPAARGGSGSHLVAGLARAGGLALVPAEQDEVPTGQIVDVMRTRP